jgi:hypothetical protein
VGHSSDSYNMNQNKKRRLQKNESKVEQRVKILGSDSASSDDSDPNHSDDRKMARPAGMSRQAMGTSESFKTVQLKEFQKVIVKRRELAKWIENEDFRQGIIGAFVKVYYHKQYVLAKIDSFA